MESKLATRTDKRRPRRQVQEVTIDDVAEAAGVSRMTVSRVLRGGHLVRAPLQERVFAAVKKLNYRLNLSARALAGSGPSRVAFVYQNPSPAFLSELLTGALRESSKLGMQLTLTADADTQERTASRRSPARSPPIGLAPRSTRLGHRARHRPAMAA